MESCSSAGRCYYYGVLAFRLSVYGVVPSLGRFTIMALVTRHVQLLHNIVVANSRLINVIAIPYSIAFGDHGALIYVGSSNELKLPIYNRNHSKSRWHGNKHLD